MLENSLRNSMIPRVYNLVKDILHHLVTEMIYLASTVESISITCIRN